MALKAVLLFRWRGVCTKVLLLFYLSQDKGFRHWSQRCLRSDMKYHGRHWLVEVRKQSAGPLDQGESVMEAVILVRKSNKKYQ